MYSGNDAAVAAGDVADDGLESVDPLPPDLLRLRFFAFAFLLSLDLGLASDFLESLWLFFDCETAMECFSLTMELKSEFAVDEVVLSQLNSPSLADSGVGICRELQTLI